MSTFTVIGEDAKAGNVYQHVHPTTVKLNVPDKNCVNDQQIDNGETPAERNNKGIDNLTYEVDIDDGDVSKKTTTFQPVHLTLVSIFFVFLVLVSFVSL